MTLPLDGGSVAHVRDLFTDSLWQVLVSAVDAREAVAKIVYSAKLREEAMRLDETFRQRVAPIGGERLRTVLTEIATGRGLGDLEPDNLERVMRPYAVALNTLPEDVLREAMRSWDAGAFFGGKKPMPGLDAIMPTAHQIQDLATKAMTEIQTVSWRLRKVREAVDRMPKPAFKADRPTRADLIEQGILDADGRVVLPKKGEHVPTPVAHQSEPEESF